MNFSELTSYTDAMITIDDFLPAIGNDAVIKTIYSNLLATPRRISSIFFYDATGSKLFEQITRLPEYYLTRIERTLLRQAADDLAENLGDMDIVEIGSGDCSKISILLNAIPEYQWESIRYIPVDVSQAAIEESANILIDRFPGLRVHGVAADFMKQLHVIPDGAKRLFCFLGSTLGNLTPEEAGQFFMKLGDLMNRGDVFLLGVDMVKPIDVLEQAYNDSRNVTAEFNRNILKVVNNLTGTNFNPLAFNHIAFYNDDASRIEMHLQARGDMKISSPQFPRTIMIERDEMIHTENSYKFTMETIAALADASGLKITKTISDNCDWFSLIQMYK